MSSDAPTIGGFFGLELPSTRGSQPPSDAVLFGSGRACLRAILEATRAERLVAPYYICDAALEPARALQLPVSFYPVDRALRPVISQIGARDLVLVVDYFGLVGLPNEALLSLGERLLLDQTQALFAGGPATCWRFTSARKWFGVPDGAYLWGPQPLAAPEPASLLRIPPHLVEKRWGDPAKAYSAFQQAEAAISAEVSPISAASMALLGGVDTAWVRETRRRNYRHLLSRLGAVNTLHLPLGAHEVPFCYPLLPVRTIAPNRFAAEGIFVPQFWSDCLRRADANFGWEQDLSRRLLPLPIDHRYGQNEMDRVADAVLAAIDMEGT